MKVIVIFLVAFVVFLGCRLLVVLLYELLLRVLNVLIKKSTGEFMDLSENTKFELAISVGFFMIYLQALVGAIEGVISNWNIDSNLEWYIIYTSIGISAILWCYLNWQLRWKAKPSFGADSSSIMIKKIVVFSAVMLFTFYHGYAQVNKHFNGEDVDLVITITNLTVVPGIIALDRVLNQVRNLINEKTKQEKK